MAAKQMKNGSKYMELEKISKASLSPKEFTKLSEFIKTEYGIKMPEAKKQMLQSRLQKRLRSLKMNNYKDYISYLFSKEGKKNDEFLHLIDVVSTNKTDFFREPLHFDFLKYEIVPQFLQYRKNNTLNIWSAACSSGEEPYTIAITLQEMTEEYTELDYAIFATDVSNGILNKAREAVYKLEKIAGIPMEIKRKYFLKHRDPGKKIVKICPELRRRIFFQSLNLMEPYYNVKRSFDVVFCRNTLIYFDRETQQKVINKLCVRLKPGGYFFLGHSESIIGMTVPLKQIKPTIFMRN